MRFGFFRRARGAAARTNGECTPGQLRRAAELRRACYEVWPDWELVAGRKVQVGFEVDLYAEAAGLVDEPCAAIYEELKRIALAALPGDAGEADVDVLPFDHAFHESLRRNFRPEIALALHVLHRRGVGQPLRECEKKCLAGIEYALQELGVKRAN